MNASLRRRLVFLAKLAVTCALLAWVASRSDLRAMADRLRGAGGPWLALAFLVGAVNVSLGALRWRLLLRALGTELPRGTALRLFWSSLFFNTFLPAGVVGDALRGAWTARASDPARAFSSVVLDRVAALVALTAVAAVGLALPGARRLPAAGTLAAAALLLGVPAALLLAFPQTAAALAVRLGGARVARILDGKVTAAPPAGPRLQALAVASFLHLLVVATMTCLARAASVEVSPVVLLAVVPAVLLASYVPVSISGIGVRDVALVELLGQAGVSTGGALAISVLFLVVTAGLSLIGGLVYLSSSSSGSRP